MTLELEVSSHNGSWQAVVHWTQTLTIRSQQIFSLGLVGDRLAAISARRIKELSVFFHSESHPPVP
ncbi:hypothetical protein BDP27DRAFT_1326963 [Rhodocollybia butyracea]|uniref:Uncharacterized protein n=1 Tax=Rhodocollybia butyracea TaxID=206335 RepID=A0A9P5PV67_9AGAR|nr:hypothetical protein BDP27DRAFT_1326963 [Rhodocollybia butyracea]